MYNDSLSFISQFAGKSLFMQFSCELKESSYESARRWIALLKKEREGQTLERM